jgi:DNA/RNA-binding protein KIN17
MGKNGGFLTPKAISNRIKAKGLQKLRWYCQSCQKQCRDEVNFQQTNDQIKFLLFQ